MKLLTDINLDEIVFSSDGKNITFKFIEIYKGNPSDIIKCSSVYAFHYENIFDDDEGLPVYVCEVRYTKRLKKDLSSSFKKTNLSINGNAINPNEEELFLLDIEGGDVIIEVICKSVKKTSI